MQYSVIYSADVPARADIKQFAPPNARYWNETEGDEQYEYGHLGDAWMNGHHRKWAAVLTQRKFDAFVRKLNLRAQDVETMGSIGAPGCGPGLSPAISFDRDDDDGAILNAYVTPLPDEGADTSEEAWQKVRAEIIKKYG